MLFSTASSVASTTAAKNGSSARPEIGRASGHAGLGMVPTRGARRPVASPRKISPLP